MNSKALDRRARLACVLEASRFNIVSRLSATRGLSVSALAREIGLSQSCTTRHLQVLQRHGLVRGRRVGKEVRFELVGDRPEVALLASWFDVEGDVPGPGDAEQRTVRVNPRGRTPTRSSNSRRAGAEASPRSSAALARDGSRDDNAALPPDTRSDAEGQTRVRSEPGDPEGVESANSEPAGLGAPTSEGSASHRRSDDIEDFLL